VELENTKNIAKWRFDEDLADLKTSGQNEMEHVATNRKRYYNRLTMKLFSGSNIATAFL
jgi:hypothetical protein